ncbi:MAG: proline/glycine betaine ABC transporter substrate-binding protein ProX, partial [Desulfuromonadales bacterium]|nr:proline/glycine betaine ABC transporter substrate-binding protein ProX [Desulfuromonadales bacterium]
MMKKAAVFVLFIAFGLLLSETTNANQHLPGEGVTVQPARATWNTGYFQEVLVRKGLEELGYSVKKPKELQ